MVLVVPLVPGVVVEAGGIVPGVLPVPLVAGLVVPGSLLSLVEVLGDALGGTGFVVLGVPV